MSDEDGWKGYRYAWYVIVAVMGAVTLLSYVFADAIYGTSSAFASPDTGVPVLDSLMGAVPGIVDCVRVAFFGYVVGKVLIEVITRWLSGSDKGRTAARLACSVVRYAVAIVVILYALAAAGVDVVTLIAGAGIFTLVIGLGAESLIKDILAGLFTVFEDEYRVGDIVVVDGWRGTIEEIGIRSTRIVDAGGNVMIVGNSEIGEVQNLSRELSTVTTVVSLGFEGSLTDLERIFRENVHRIREAIPEIVEGPFYKGVSGYSTYYVELTFHTICREKDYYIVERALSRELQMLYNEKEVYDPYDTYTFHGLSEDIPSYRRWKEHLRDREE